LGLLDDSAQEFRPDEVDPALVEVHGLREEVNELRQEQILLSIQREIAATKQAYPDFHDEEVLSLVAEFAGKNIPLSIEEGYFLWKGRQSTERELADARAKSKATAEAERQAAARQQAASVSSGHSPAANTQEQKDYKHLSFRDIFNEVADELGMTD
jgi:hypothetical protein